MSVRQSDKPDKPGTTAPKALRSPAELGAAIRRRRKALGLRQADVALRAGLSLPTVGAVERGKATAQIGVVLAIVRDLGLRIELAEEG